MPSSDPTQSSGFAGLRSTSWPVLGILSFGEELSGYDLKKWASYSVRFFYWSPSFS
ncbi:PadR family transcriptional regulator, partial [Rhodococcus fascians]|nr:PadR family transcriptional regulator [Rhodococcus fascians]